MRAVIVDAGNTHVRFVAWTASDRLPTWCNGDSDGAPALATLARLLTPRSAADEAAFLLDVAAVLAAAPGAPVVVASVVPRVGELLAGIVPGLLRADHTAVLPFAHDLVDAAATGADRLCNVGAAVRAGLADALVVDAGTATTIDVLSGGCFIGGVIAPGMAFALEAIGRQAARLRPVPFAAVPLAAGRDTAAAMAAGGFHAGVGGAEALIAGLLREHGPRPVVLTGGLGSFLAAPGRFLDPDWTVRGAACLCGLT